MNKNYTKTPNADIFENEEHFLVVLEMPGIDKETIDIEVKEDKLSVKAEPKTLDEKWKSLRQEFSVGSFAREFSIGQRIDRENISAHYENGILELQLAKSPEAKPKKITVNVA